MLSQRSIDTTFDRPPATSPFRRIQEDGRWTTSLCGCFEDPMNCLLTCLCPCVAFGQNARKIDSSKKTLGCVWPSLVCLLLAPLGCAGCYGCAYRSKLRGRKGIPGDPCLDFLVYCCCSTCAISQESRELKNNEIFSNKRPQRSTLTSMEGTWHAKPSVIGFSRSVFSFEEIEDATDGFSEANFLGQGGFGYVHKGTLKSGEFVAVKQLKSGSKQGEREFYAEIETISHVSHPNLVSLVGYCVHDAQKLLVYEFVPNGNLHRHLHGEDQETLAWKTRMKIAVGAAKGLAYLHEQCKPKIIHRDIKASNILIDDTFEAKVSDFGLAKHFLDTETHVSTRVMGTFGYLAPEYASTGKLTEKSDVYSFGVLLLELATGKLPVIKTSSEDISLVDWCKPFLKHVLEDGKCDALADPKLKNEYNCDEMLRMIGCGGACVRHIASLRPMMSQIVRILEREMAMDEVKIGDDSIGGWGSSESELKMEPDSREVFSDDYGNSSNFQRAEEMTTESGIEREDIVSA